VSRDVVRFTVVAESTYPGTQYDDCAQRTPCTYGVNDRGTGKIEELFNLSDLEVETETVSIEAWDYSSGAGCLEQSFYPGFFGAPRKD
jgi:hypothetical protein